MLPIEVAQLHHVLSEPVVQPLAVLHPRSQLQSRPVQAVRHDLCGLHTAEQGFEYTVRRRRVELACRITCQNIAGPGAGPSDAPAHVGAANNAQSWH